MTLLVRRLILMALMTGTLLGALFGYRHYQDRQQAAMLSSPPPPASVASAEVSATRWRPHLRSVGSVVADNEVFVANEIAGLVTRINFDSGATVAAGELIVQLDDTVDRAELDGLVAARRLAQLEFNRNAELLQKKSVSRSEYDRTQAALQQATAEVEAKRRLIAKKAVRAPFEGRLGIRQVNLGEYLPEGAHIVSLQALDPIHVDYTVPERDLARLNPDQDVVANVRAYPDTEFSGHITAIDPRIDRDTRNLRVRATFENRSQRLQPGMFAEVRTLLPVREAVPTLPRTAVTYAPYGASVFLITDGESGPSVQRKPVRTGDVRAGRVEILEGLDVGDRVVDGGQVKLRNGQSVVIDNSLSLEAGHTVP